MVYVALLDRDGVLNQDRPDYIKNAGEMDELLDAAAYKEMVGE